MLRLGQQNLFTYMDNSTKDRQSFHSFISVNRCHNGHSVLEIGRLDGLCLKETGLSTINHEKNFFSM